MDYLVGVGKKRFPFISIHFRFIGYGSANYTDKKQINRRKMNRLLTHTLCIHTGGLSDE